MTEYSSPTRSEVVDLNNIQSNFLSLRIGEEISRLEIKEIRKICNASKEDNLPGVDYKYIIETVDNDILTVNSWTLWKKIKNALISAGNIQATLYLKHSGREDYTVDIL